jgi:adenylyltransferase/sulfurtransferase
VEPDPFVRQRALVGFGAPGQDALTNARVAIVGVGGLGCPAAQYLAAAGVGSLTLIDSDTVSVTNLHRQILFGPDDVGARKVDAAAKALAERYPWTAVTSVATRLTPDTARDVLAGHDVILDGTDTWSSRHTVADAASVLGIPLVWGAVSGWFGQVTVFDGGLQLRDVFPNEPPPGLAACEGGGVLGAMCGQVGTAMATQAVMVLAGAGTGATGLRGRLSILDSRNGEWRTVAVGRHAAVGE